MSSNSQNLGTATSKRLTARLKSGVFAGKAVCPDLYVHGTSVEKYDTAVIDAMIQKLALFEDGVEKENIATHNLKLLAHLIVQATDLLDMSDDSGWLIENVCSESLGQAVELAQSILLEK